MEKESMGTHAQETNETTPITNENKEEHLTSSLNDTSFSDPFFTNTSTHTGLSDEVKAHIQAPNTNEDPMGTPIYTETKDPLKDTAIHTEIKEPLKNTPIDASNASIEKTPEQKTPEQKKSGSAPQASFFSSHPIEQLVSPLAPSLVSKTTKNLGYIFIIPLFIVFAVHMHFAWYDTNVWFTEKYPIKLLENFLAQTSFLPPPLFSEFVATSPLYLFFLKVLSGAVPIALQSAERLLMASTAIGSVVFLCTTFLFGRFIARAQGHILLLAGLILVSSLPFLWVLFFSGIHFYFASLVLLSTLCFYFTCQKNRSLLLVFLSYGFATLAVALMGGAGLFVPLCATFLFTVWRGTPLRLFRPDSLLGLFLALLGIVLWHVFLFSAHEFAFDSLFVIGKNLVSTSLTFIQTSFVWWHIGVVFCVLLSPWIFVVICLPWLQVVTPAFWQGVMQTRTKEKEGIAFLSSFALVGVLTYVLTSVPFYQSIFTVLPALALLAVRGLYRFTAVSAAVFRYGMCLVLLAFAVGISALVLMSYTILPLSFFVPEFIQDIAPNIFFLFIPILLIVAAVILYFGLQNNRIEGVIWLVALLFMSITYPLFIQMTPLLNKVLDPEPQTISIQPYIQANYQVFGIGVNAHMYAPFNGPIVNVVSFETVKDLMLVDEAGTITPFAKEAPFVVVTTAQHAQDFSALTLLRKQWIYGQEVSAFISSTVAPMAEGTADDVIEDEGIMDEAELMENEAELMENEAELMENETELMENEADKTEE